MEFRGHVHKGVIVPDDNARLPEGTGVRIVVEHWPSSETSARRHRITLPLVPSEHPASLRLTGEDVARLLEEDDLAF